MWCMCATLCCNACLNKILNYIFRVHHTVLNVSRICKCIFFRDFTKWQSIHIGMTLQSFYISIVIIFHVSKLFTSFFPQITVVQKYFFLRKLLFSLIKVFMVEEIENSTFAKKFNQKAHYYRSLKTLLFFEAIFS